MSKTTKVSITAITFLLMALTVIGSFYDFEIGTDVFLTQEEAERKLKELNNNGKV